MGAFDEITGRGLRRGRLTRRFTWVGLLGDLTPWNHGVPEMCHSKQPRLEDRRPWLRHSSWLYLRELYVETARRARGGSGRRPEKP